MKRVLVAPLDWGLGHATRCIPIIQELRTRSCEVSIAGCGDSLTLLKAEFPSLKFFELPGYAPRYSSRGSMVWAMARQLPKFLKTIRREHDCLEEIVREEKIDVVISDNRYGCWSSHAVSVLITHQSNVLMPKRFGWLAPFVRLAVTRSMKRFRTCWIPDYQDHRSLTRELNRNVNGSARFIGQLSRFNPSGNIEKKYTLLCILSGPEPQRTMLENILIRQIDESLGKVLIVRGLPGGGAKLTTTAQVVDFMTTSELQHAIESAHAVIARSGFSTIMDLSKLRARAIFIPTPGQTEQEFLARELQRKNIALCREQASFDLAEAMREIGMVKGFTSSLSQSKALDDALEEILT